MQAVRISANLTGVPALCLARLWTVDRVRMTHVYRIRVTTFQKMFGVLADVSNMIGSTPARGD